MSNPAEDLHDLLSRWRESIPNGGHLLNAVDPRTPEGAEEILYFYGLIRQIDDLLLEYELHGTPVGLYRRQLKNWLRVPLAMNNGWTAGGSAEKLIPADWLDQVEGLALFFRGKVHDFPMDRIDDLKSIVNSAIQLLADDDELPDALRTYIHDLLASITIAMTHHHVGLTFDYANAVRNLYVAFTAAEAKSGTHSKFWGDLGRKIVSDVASHISVSATTAIATLALTQL